MATGSSRSGTGSTNGADPPGPLEDLCPRLDSLVDALGPEIRARGLSTDRDMVRYLAEESTLFYPFLALTPELLSQRKDLTLAKKLLAQGECKRQWRAHRPGPTDPKNVFEMMQFPTINCPRSQIFKPDNTGWEQPKFVSNVLNKTA